MDGARVKPREACARSASAEHSLHPQPEPGVILAFLDQSARIMTGRVVEVKAVVRTTRLRQTANVMRFFHRNSLNAHALVDGILKPQAKPSEFMQREARSLRFLQRIRICL